MAACVLVVVVLVVPGPRQVEQEGCLVWRGAVWTAELL